MILSVAGRNGPGGAPAQLPGSRAIREDRLARIKEIGHSGRSRHPQFLDIAQAGARETPTAQKWGSDGRLRAISPSSVALNEGNLPASYRVATIPHWTLRTNG
jgi:hypothetical protein